MQPTIDRSAPSPIGRLVRDRLVRLAVFSPLLLACSGIPLTCGRTVNKVIPAVREIDPDFDTVPVDCDPEFPSTAPRGCSITTLTCGSIVEGNNDTEFYRFDGSFYVAKACTPEHHGYDKGPDAPYALELPSNIWADIHLVSDCADLDIFSATWDRPSQCPTPSHAINQCEADVSRRGGKITITTVNKPEQHLVWVDGKYGATGNYRLEVKCREYR